MTLESVASRASFASALAVAASSGKKTLLLAPLGAGKTHSLLAARDALREASIPFVFINLFTAASTPEHLLETLARSVTPFMERDAEAIRGLAAEGATDRHQSSSALLRLLNLFLLDHFNLGRSLLLPLQTRQLLRMLILSKLPPASATGWFAW